MSFLLHFISCDFVNIADAIDSLLIFIAGVLAGLDPRIGPPGRNPLAEVDSRRSKSSSGFVIPLRHRVHFKTLGKPNHSLIQ